MTACSQHIKMCGSVFWPTLHVAETQYMGQYKANLHLFTAINSIAVKDRSFLWHRRNKYFLVESFTCTTSFGFSCRSANLFLPPFHIEDWRVVWLTAVKWTKDTTPVYFTALLQQSAFPHLVHFCRPFRIWRMCDHESTHRILPWWGDWLWGGRYLVLIHSIQSYPLARWQSPPNLLLNDLYLNSL